MLAAEILKAGADPNIKGLDGRTPIELTNKDEIKKLLQEAMDKKIPA